MPKIVAEEIIRIQRRFLWNGDKECRVKALVRWEIVQRPKNKGGLGIQDLLLKNIALLFKWWWRYTCEEGHLWRRIINSIYEQDNGVMPSQTVQQVQGPWREIKRIMERRGEVQHAMQSKMKITVGAGDRIIFWKDQWMIDGPLQKVFPVLYKASMQKKAMIKEMGWYEGEIWKWGLSWRRALNMEGVTQEQQLMTLLQGVSPRRLRNDEIKWDTSKPFSVKDLLSITEEARPPYTVSTVDSLAGTVWKGIAPPKVEFFLWLAVLGRLRTMDKLVRWGMEEVGTGEYVFCKEVIRVWRSCIIEVHTCTTHMGEYSDLSGLTSSTVPDICKVLPMVDGKEVQKQDKEEDMGSFDVCNNMDNMAT